MRVLSPKSVANYFLDLAAASGQPITPMKLQKLVYYAHGWYAGYTEQPLINEPVEAWQYGPVIPSLYHEFKRFGSGVIKGKATDVDFDREGFCEVPPPSDPNLRAFLDNIWKSYGRYTGIALSEMTHASGSPWHETWSKCAGMKGTDIPFSAIKDHFKSAVLKTNLQGVVV
jgi:uncharacterized phage-associated protein